MRARYLVALSLSLGACAAPPAGTVTADVTPFGQPCARQCTVRVVNQTKLPLTVLATTPDGTRAIGSVAAQKEVAIGQAILAPTYLATPEAAVAHGDAASDAVTCSTQSPRPGEDVLLVCK